MCALREDRYKGVDVYDDKLLSNVDSHDNLRFPPAPSLSLSVSL